MIHGSIFLSFAIHVGSGGRWLARREEAARRAAVRFQGANNPHQTGVISTNGRPVTSQMRLSSAVAAAANSNGDHVGGGSSSGHVNGGRSSLEDISSFMRAAPPGPMVSGSTFGHSAQDLKERRVRAEEVKIVPVL